MPATQKLCARLGLTVGPFGVIELNEAFAAQCLAVHRQLGHPLGMSGARLAGTAALDLSLAGGQFAPATLCVGAGQGIALALGAP